MSIAKGTKSILTWVAESAFNTTPMSATWKDLLFSTESLAQNINKIQSKDIRADRANPVPRGGNIATGGSITGDFAISRWGVWLKHLLAGTLADTTVTVGAGNAATYARGTFLKNTGGSTHGLFLVTEPGAYTGDTTDFDSDVAGMVAGQKQVLPGGDLVLTVLCITPVSVATPTVYQHVITAGVAFPTGGISIEKQILGGSVSNYTVFSGGRLNTLGLTFPQEGIIQSAWGFLGIQTNGYHTATIDTGHSDAGTIATDTPVVGSELYLVSSLVSLTGEEICRPIQQMTMNVSNGFDDNVYQINDRFRADLAEGTRVINGSLSAYFEDAAEYQAFLNESKLAIRTSLCSVDGYMQIDTPEVKLFGSANPQISGPGVIVGSYDYEAFKQTSAFDCKITIVDLNASLI